MSNNTVVSVHETYRENLLYHARFCIIYNRTRSWLEHSALKILLVISYIEAYIMLRFNHKQHDL